MKNPDRNFRVGQFWIKIFRIKKVSKRLSGNEIIFEPWQVSSRDLITQSLSMVIIQSFSNPVFASWQSIQIFATMKIFGFWLLKVIQAIWEQVFVFFTVKSNKINTNWKLLDQIGHQNQWLIRTLYEAEKKNEKVALIGHIPPGGEDQIYACSKAFYDIINRFKNTVTSQFYGHTHWDHIKLFYDADRVPSNIAYITPRFFQEILIV